MKQISTRIAVAALVVFGTLALFSSMAAAQDASGTYKAKCAMCHGPDGKGSAMGTKMGVRDFGSADVQKETDAQLADIISSGKGKMPAYKDKLKDSEIKDLVTYIRSLAKK